jgi:hypothetical protein
MRWLAVVWLAIGVGAAGCSCSNGRMPLEDAGTVDDTGVPVDAGSPGVDAAAETRLMSGVTLDGVAVFQGVRVGLFSGGALVTPNAPIVAGRAATVRAYLDPAAHAGATITGELEVREGDRVVTVLRDARVITRTSDDADPASVLSFELPADVMTTTASFAVRLVDPAGDPAAAGSSHAARLPRDGTFRALGAASDGSGLHVVLVPLRWDSDGSGRLPDTSDAQLAIVRALFLSVYPLAHLTIDVHAPVPWSGGLTFTGNVDFGAVNSMLMDLRTSDGAAPGAYYYALAAPSDTFDAYCGRSCVTGQSYVVDAPADADFRVGSGVGFSGEDSVWTMVHELGHEHGRDHAPCSAGSPDPSFPYAGGGIGVWGLDQRTHAFVDPSAVSDFMGYCDPEWSSDYTWSAIFERTVAVSALASARAPRWLARIGGEVGGASAGVMSVAMPRGGAPVLVRWLDARGQLLSIAVGRAIAQSHTSERLAVLPLPPLGAVTAEVDGHTIALE